MNSGGHILLDIFVALLVNAILILIPGFAAALAAKHFLRIATSEMFFWTLLGAGFASWLVFWLFYLSPHVGKSGAAVVEAVSLAGGGYLLRKEIKHLGRYDLIDWLAPFGVTLAYSFFACCVLFAKDMPDGVNLSFLH